MPGSPPISTTAPATRPPPSTRSNSSRPVGWRGVSRASISDRLRTGLLLASGAYRWAAADGADDSTVPPACSRHCSAGICPATSRCRRIRRKRRRFDSLPSPEFTDILPCLALAATACGRFRVTNQHGCPGLVHGSFNRLSKTTRIRETGARYKKLTAGFLQIAHNQAITRNDNPPAFTVVPAPGPGPGAMAKSPRDRWAAFQDAALNRNTPKPDETAGPPARRTRRSNVHAPCHRAHPRGVRA